FGQLLLLRLRLRHRSPKEYEDGQSTDADRKSDSPFHRRISFLLCLDLNMFRLSLPAQRSLFDHRCYFVHDDNHDHQYDDADEDVGGLEDSGRHADEKADPFGGGDEFTDDGADHGEGDTGADARKDVRRYRRKDHLKG